MKLDRIAEFVREIPDRGAIIGVANRADRSELIEAVHTLCGAAAVGRLVIAVLSPADLAKLAAQPLQVSPFRVLLPDAETV